ncbi:hypothetical protein [Chondromyces apiculatus]|uniref:hypothetical protein n=1 Tax=Chondromyces apiculatus TaxID=51 RepID=UPI0005C6EBC1|nr:hypothetical protein [Chondromyces apiculatus]
MLQALAAATVLSLRATPLLAQSATPAPPASSPGGASTGGAPTEAASTEAGAEPSSGDGARVEDAPAAVSEARAGEEENEEALRPRPPPLHVEYAQYGVALTTELNLDAGAACTEKVSGFEPCILGSGGGILIRGGYRSPGPWYFGGSYEFTKMDSSNLYRLGIFQQLRAEMRYLPDLGYRLSPYFSAGLGGVAYGNEWGAETGGAVLTLGAGAELEISRLTVIGLSAGYRPVLLAGWTDTAGYRRRTAIAQFFGLELMIEVRTELGRR